MNQNTQKISVHDAANRYIILNRPLKLKARIKELLYIYLTDLLSVVYTIKHLSKKYSNTKRGYVYRKECTQFTAPRYSLIYQKILL